MTGNEILPAFLKLDKNKRIKTYTVVFQCIYKLSGKMPAWKMKKKNALQKNIHIFCTLCAGADCDTEPKTDDLYPFILLKLDCY